jgi:hypothetical protein
MLNNLRTIGIVCTTLCLALGGVGTLANQGVAQPSSNTVFSAKFVCGTQLPTSSNQEPTVRPGSYATDINIHNYHPNQPVTLEKQVILLVVGDDAIGREPNLGKQFKPLKLTLPPGQATMDDCTAIRKLIPDIPSAPRLIVGFLQIKSSDDLNVTGVYTVNPPSSAGAPSSGPVSIDVESIQGKPLK